jgi:hypothetical protein
MEAAASIRGSYNTFPEIMSLSLYGLSSLVGTVLPGIYFHDIHFNAVFKPFCQDILNQT